MERGTTGKNMKNQSIRKLYVQDCQILADIMGFEKKSLDNYAGRYVKITLKSPKEITGVGGTTYQNRD